MLLLSCVLTAVLGLAQHLDEILDEEGNVMLIARDVDGNTTANINGRSFDVQIDRQARARAAALCATAGLCSIGGAFAADCGSHATASPCSCKHAAACCIHAVSISSRHTWFHRLIFSVCLAVPLHVWLWFVGFVIGSCSLLAITAPDFSWHSCEQGGAVHAQELLHSVGQAVPNGTSEDQVNLTLRFTGQGRQEAIQVGGV